MPVVEEQAYAQCVKGKGDITLTQDIIPVPDQKHGILVALVEAQENAACAMVEGL